MSLPRPRGIAIPLVCYLAVTVGLPLANGAGGSPAFTEHALTTLLVSGLICVAATTARRKRGSQGPPRRGESHKAIVRSKTSLPARDWPPVRAE